MYTIVPPGSAEYLLVVYGRAAGDDQYVGVRFKMLPVIGWAIPRGGEDTEPEPVALTPMSYEDLRIGYRSGLDGDPDAFGEVAILRDGLVFAGQMEGAVTLKRYVEIRAFGPALSKAEGFDELMDWARTKTKVEVPI